MKKLIILAIFAAIAIAFVSFDLGQYLTLDFIKSQQTAIHDYYLQHQLLTLLTYFAVYVIVTAVSLPGAAVMTLAAGAFFGLIYGVILVSFASSIGATCAFLASRYVLRDAVQKRFPDRLKTINQGIEKDGVFYLFALRLVPAFPFFVINLLMGLTSIKTWSFYWVSQLGMFAGTVVYVNAGTQLAQIESLSGILSPTIVLSFVLLAILPFIGRKIVQVMAYRKVMKDFPKPAKFDTNLIVIGAGSAGLVTAYIAAAVKARVTLIEKHLMGGDCLNTGCVPSKALIRSAKYLSHISRSQEFGIKKASAEFDFSDVMQRVQSVVTAIQPHDSVERYSKLGIDVVQGDAHILTPYSVRVNDQVITARNIVVATGASPLVPPIEGIQEIEYYTSDNLWQMHEKPASLLVLGGGPIGCELAQSFNRLGIPVTQVEMFERLMMREDAEVSALVMEKFTQEGIDVRLKHKAKRFIRRDGLNILIAEHQGEEVELVFDQLLVAVGRAANTRGFGLQEVGVRIASNGTIDVNEFLQTSIPTIYACGDVAGPYQFTHTAAHQAWYSSVNALFGIFKRFKADYSVIPWATFTEPEVARVGLNEQDARQQNIDYEVTRFGIDDLDRAIADAEAHGFIKVLSVPGKDKILGVTIVGEHAADLIAEYVLAMKHGLGLNKILGTIHIYPTLAEANKYVAGEWKRAHAPQRLLQWVARFHRWMRH
jgi:pyruvate/2-oxoglutarate dehydrogenase complex dihydrolipoamide dehydrogenase (E3) component/uncharacterized membrane protein YdjX (TVP38/TMEM64 family)